MTAIKTSKHRHTDKCKNPWGALLCKQNVAPMLKGIQPVKTDEGTYSLGASQYAPFYGGTGAPIFARVRVLRNGRHAGSLYYQPHSYPQSPWSADMSQLRWTVPGDADPFRNPEAQAFDFNSNSPQAALGEFARRANTRICFFRDQKEST